jgi:hypothetical protein
LAVSSSLVIGNQAVAGPGANVFVGPDALSGGVGAQGGGVLNFIGAKLSTNNTVVAANAARGGHGMNGGPGSPAQGGGVMNAVYGTLNATNLVVTGNQATGGNGDAGGAGGNALGGGFDNDPNATATLTGVVLAGNTAQGGTGVSGGNAYGGGAYSAGTFTLIDGLVAGNDALGGPAGQGLGGGVYLAPSGTAVLTNSKVKGNHASTADDNIFGSWTQG